MSFLLERHVAPTYTTNVRLHAVHTSEFTFVVNLVRISNACPRSGRSIATPVTPFTGWHARGSNERTSQFDELTYRIINVIGKHGHLLNLSATPVTLCQMSRRRWHAALD